MELKQVAVRDRIDRITETAEALRWERADVTPRFARLRRAAGERLIRTGLALLPRSPRERPLRAHGAAR